MLFTQQLASHSQATTIYFIITGVTSDALVVDIVTVFIQDGGLVTVANEYLSIPLLSATLNTITAAGAGGCCYIAIACPKMYVKRNGDRLL